MTFYNHISPHNIKGFIYRFFILFSYKQLPLIISTYCLQPILSDLIPNTLFNCIVLQNLIPHQAIILNLPVLPTLKLQPFHFIHFLRAFSIFFNIFIHLLRAFAIFFNIFFTHITKASHLFLYPQSTSRLSFFSFTLFICTQSLSQHLLFNTKNPKPCAILLYLFLFDLIKNAKNFIIYVNFELSPNRQNIKNHASFPDFS